MSLPCPHCGNKESLADRDPDEIKPVVPINQRDDYEKFPLPESTFSSFSSSDLESLYDSAKEQQPIAIEHEFEGPPSISSAKSHGITHESTLVETTTDAVINTRFDQLESTITTVEDGMKALSLDTKKVLNSLRVIEGILLEISKELLSLREK
ncbi:MAG: hypothetical protein ACXADY_20635 [Candidatus Hodarchaeales archaeon]|jgi:hypothetical protein